MDDVAKDIGVYNKPGAFLYNNVPRGSTSTSTFALSHEDDSESVEARIERLGRQRPDQFKCIWSEIGFVYSVVMSQVLTEYFVSGFNVILPPITTELDITPAKATWPANAFSLIVSAFLLTFGRVSDMYGGYVVYVAGVLWLAIWSIIAGFARNELTIILCRALQGLGPAAFLPSSLLLLGSMYRPGPRKNIIYGIYGAAAPLGFFIGIFFAGISGQYATWNIYFWIGAGLSLSTAIVAYFTIPFDLNERKNFGVKMDWLGTFLISTGLILVVFAITDSAHSSRGWATPYIYICLTIGVLLLLIAVYVERWVAEMPLLPIDLFQVPYMKPLMLAVFFSFGTLGIYLLYSTYYMTHIMGGTPLQLVAWYTPLALGGCIIATAGGFVLHLVPGTVMMLITGVAGIFAPLLFAIMPLGGSYWLYTFWAMLCTTIAIDISFSLVNIFISTSMPTNRQGLAGAVVNSILQLGIALFLGFADVIAEATRHKGLRESYQIVFWYAVGCAGFSLVILLGFVRIDKAKSDLTADEKEALKELEMKSSDVHVNIIKL